MPSHTPVLLKEVLSFLSPKKAESYLDVTAGYGGHASAVLQRLGPSGHAVLVDRDAQAVTQLKQNFRSNGAKIIRSDFLSASRSLDEEGRRFDMILADLGVSSPHLESGKRGFSIRHNGPLDMRMDGRQQLNAASIVNSATQEELVRIFSQYGEEPKAAAVAKRIIRERPLKTTDQLAAIAASVWRGGSRRHPATRVFQALRIAVNDELGQLEESLPIWLKMLKPGGRIAVISFHSLEDRVVKRFFAQHSAALMDGELRILTKKPIAASEDEKVSNPRARSAKLRAAVKINTKRKDQRKA